MDSVFNSEDIKKLLHNKFVVIIGDSIQRGIYKDLVKSIQTNQTLSPKDLRAKGEESFCSDELIEGGCRGQMTNGKNYREVRQYQTPYHLIRFYIVTRCYSQYVETILADLAQEPRPDIVIMNSCLWDISRYGVESMKSFQENLQQLFGFLKEKLSTEMTLWTTALPVGKLTELSIVDVAEELKVWLLKRKVEESNKGEREEGELSDSDSGNEDSDDDIEVLNANPSPLRTQITSIMKSIELPDYFTKDELIEQLTEIIQRTCRNGNSMEAIQQAICNGPCFLEETNVEEKMVDMEELEDDFPEVMEIIETAHEMVKKSQTSGKVTDKQIAEEIIEANEYAMKLAAERDIDIVDLHKLLRNQMDLLENDLVHWKSEAMHLCTNNIMQHIDENKHKLPEKGWLERAAEKDKEEVLNGFENASVNEDANALQDDENKDDSQSPCHSVHSEGQGVQGEGYADEGAGEQNRNSEQEVEDKSNGYTAENVEAEEMVKKLTLVEQASIETETASGHEMIPEEVSQVLDQILKETTEQPADFLSPLRPGVGDIPKQQQEAEITCESTKQNKDNCLEEKAEDVIVELIEGDQEVKVVEEMVVEEVHVVENPSEKDACSEMMEKMSALNIDKKGSDAGADSLPYDPDSFDPTKENLRDASSPDLDSASPEPANPQEDPAPLAVNPASPEIDPASPSSLDSLSPDRMAVAPALPDNLVADIDMSGESGYDTPGKTPVGHILERAIIPPSASESTSSPLLKGTGDQPGKNDEAKGESNEGIVENAKEDTKEKGDSQPVKFFTPQKPVVMKNPLMEKIRYLTPQAKGTKSSVTVNTPEQQVPIPPKRETPTIVIEPPEDELEDEVISTDINSPVVQNEKNKDDEKEESLTTNRRESLSVPEDNSPIKTEMPGSYRNEQTADDNEVGQIRSEAKCQDGDREKKKDKNVDSKSTTDPASDSTKPEVKDEPMCEEELLEGKIGAEKSDDKDCVIL